MYSDDKALISMFRNVPVALHGWHIMGDADVAEDGGECRRADVMVNDAFCQLVGYSPRDMDSVFGGRLVPMVFDEDQERFMRTVHELYEYPHEQVICFRIRRKDGAVIVVEDTICSVRQADGSVWLYAFMRPKESEDKQKPDIRRRESDKRVQVQTFGYFNVLIDGRPIAFEHEKAKELFALLVDRRGKYVSSSEIISCLWEDESVNENTQGRCRKAVFYLRRLLAKHGLENLIESTGKGLRRIRTEMIDCDLYHYLSGEQEYQSSFRGAYMTDYFWAEQTLSGLMFEK